MSDAFVDGPGPLLKGRIAVITGGGGTIGGDAARLFAEHGAHVVVVDIDPALAAAVVADVKAAGGSADAVTTDVRNAAEIAQLRDRVLQEHGRVDVLVNNVGHWVKHSSGFLGEDAEFWRDLHEVNFLHVVTVSHAFLPSMIERRSGSIINVSSIEALRGYPVAPVYGAYKAAVVQFTRCLGVQLGNFGVRVNGIGPDVTESLQVPYSDWIPKEQLHLWPQWVPVGRMGVGADQARVLLFLASDLSAFVTGHTIPTDGGTGAAGGWFRSDSRHVGTGWTNRPINP